MRRLSADWGLCIRDVYASAGHDWRAPDACHCPVSTAGSRCRSARSGGFRSRRTRGPGPAGRPGSWPDFARCAVSLRRWPPRRFRERRSPTPPIHRFVWPPSPGDRREAIWRAACPTAKSSHQAPISTVRRARRTLNALAINTPCTSASPRNTPLY